MVKYKGNFYFPIVSQYSETTFGGDLKTEADYLDPYVQNLINQHGFFIMPFFKYSYDTINYNLKTSPPTPPSMENILGTDDQARDIFARVLYGMRISLIFGILLTVFSSIIGVSLGAIQGYYGGLTDLFMQRIIEIWSGLPVLFMLIILSTFITPNFWWLLLIMVLFNWMTLVSPVRAEFLKARNLEYIQAAKVSGVKERHIIFKHILPNAMVASITFIPFILSGSIILLTSLDFLGFGLPPGSPSLGEILSQGKNNISSYWIGLTAFTIISFILTIIIFIGEGIREMFH